MIVLCDDDADQRLALRLALEQVNYSVRVAADARKALALLREKASPVVITDIFMPDTAGLELVNAIKRDFPETRIIVISAGRPTRTVDYLASAELIGVDATLRKPFKVTKLLSILQELARPRVQ